MSWQAFIDDTTDGTIYPDWLKFEQAFNAAVKAGKVPPQSQIVLRKAPKVPQVPRVPDTPQVPQAPILIPPPSYTVPRMRHEQEVKAQANLTILITVALIVGIAFGIYLGVR